MKTFDKKDVYLWSNAEEAKQYIGKRGYFGNDLHELKMAINAENCGVLTDPYPRLLEEYDDLVFLKDNNSHYRYFLPSDRVREEEE